MYADLKLPFGLVTKFLISIAMIGKRTITMIRQVSQVATRQVASGGVSIIRFTNGK